MSQTPRDLLYRDDPDFWPNSIAVRRDMIAISASQEGSYSRHICLMYGFEQVLALYAAGEPMPQVALAARHLLGRDLPAFLADFPPATGSDGTKKPNHAALLRHAAMLYLSRPTPADARAFAVALAPWQAGKPVPHNPVLARMVEAIAPDVPQQFGTEVAWVAAYGSLWTAIDPKTQRHLRRRALLDFMDGWYEQMTTAGLAESGRTQPGNLSYVGHWCLEGAAAVVMLGMNDVNLRNHPNYPADWVDYARATPAPS